MTNSSVENPQAINPLPDTGVRTSYSSGAVRDASIGKGKPHLIPPEALRRLAIHYENGGRKYKDRNWEKGIPLSSFVDSLYRHLWSVIEGETDEDHGAAVIWNAVGLLQTKHWIDTNVLPKTLDDMEGPNEYQPEIAVEPYTVCVCLY